MVVVSGPGTGKSHLFLSRLQYWLGEHPDKNVAVATFVRKLVHDLNDEIRNSEEIAPDDLARVSVYTLHRLARSIIERNRGTKALPLGPHTRVITQNWEEVVWSDVFCLENQSPDRYLWNEYQDALYDGEPPSEASWSALREAHLRLQVFYNALTFAEQIMVATQAVRESRGLVVDTLFIIDEFQDFNLAEENLIQAITAESSGVLIVGDDDQVLYDRLRRGHANIIRRYYNDASFSKAILPFCSRCNSHICACAEAFLAAGRSDDSIRKMFLPLDQESTVSKVGVVATTNPRVGVEFITTRFFERHAESIQQRQDEIDRGTNKDAYLLILTPARGMNFLTGGARDDLLAALSNFATAGTRPGPDYWKVRDYYHTARDPSQNFNVRKILAYENVERETVCTLLNEALNQGKNLADLADSSKLEECLTKCRQAHDLLDTVDAPRQQAEQLRAMIAIDDVETLAADLERHPIRQTIDGEDDGLDLQQAGATTAVQLTTIVGSKGLSADHVVVLGCDNTNLEHVSRSAFFVALTRAKKSLTLLACMRGGGASGLHPFVCSLPDAHVAPYLAKAHGELERYDDIGALQGHLNSMERAASQSRRRSGDRGSSNR